MGRPGSRRVSHQASATRFPTPDDLPEIIVDSYPIRAKAKKALARRLASTPTESSPIEQVSPVSGKTWPTSLTSSQSRIPAPILEDFSGITGFKEVQAKMAITAQKQEVKEKNIIVEDFSDLTGFHATQVKLAVKCKKEGKALDKLESSVAVVESKTPVPVSAVELSASAAVSVAVLKAANLNPRSPTPLFPIGKEPVYQKEVIDKMIAKFQADEIRKVAEQIEASAKSLIAALLLIVEEPPASSEADTEIVANVVVEDITATEVKEVGPETETREPDLTAAAMDTASGIEVQDHEVVESPTQLVDNAEVAADQEIIEAKADLTSELPSVSPLVAELEPKSQAREELAEIPNEISDEAQEPTVRTEQPTEEPSTPDNTTSEESTTDSSSESSTETPDDTDSVDKARLETTATTEPAPVSTTTEKQSHPQSSEATPLQKFEASTRDIAARYLGDEQAEPFAKWLTRTICGKASCLEATRIDDDTVETVKEEVSNPKLELLENLAKDLDTYSPADWSAVRYRMAGCSVDQGTDQINGSSDRVGKIVDAVEKLVRFALGEGEEVVPGLTDIVKLFIDIVDAYLEAHFIHRAQEKTDNSLLGGGFYGRVGVWAALAHQNKVVEVALQTGVVKAVTQIEIVELAPQVEVDEVATGEKLLTDDEAEEIVINAEDAAIDAEDVPVNEEAMEVPPVSEPTVQPWQIGTKSKSILEVKATNTSTETRRLVLPTESWVDQTPTNDEVKTVPYWSTSVSPQPLAHWSEKIRQELRFYSSRVLRV
ncbi:hypothetical protein B0H66DRAFT_630800 [Apodospora peruviana]|uniref:Uncharacterized protein n=1 Tax=Apodospora peruviana TaxID=516989 RepID=A0AAE0HWQ2_9PEZI|nr:hypothetical protein B0H66DRAFT_630800 [Apodospora peruviana]